jgi:hypothetical protein
MNMQYAAEGFSCSAGTIIAVGVLRRNSSTGSVAA